MREQSSAFVPTSVHTIQLLVMIKLDTGLIVDEGGEVYAQLLVDGSKANAEPSQTQ